MNIELYKSSIKKQSSITVTGSKSESNRLLLLQALFPTIGIQNLSNSDDTIAMSTALLSNSQLIDVHHAGTTMRFLTAFLATQDGREITLTGSTRMQERPIKVLVDALIQLGADITYKNDEGYPPLSIKGKLISKNKVSINANVSSQYISALLLIAPSLENGLELTLVGEITSIPYIKMTLGLLNQIGVDTDFKDNLITVKPIKVISPITLTVESDWSSASYFYSIVALSNIGTQITLSSYKENSLQGDSVLSSIYKDFGVETTFVNNSIILQKIENCKKETIHCQLNNSPDIAQTIAVTCLALGVNCNLEGLHTLKIKETDRLVALKNEIEKFGTQISITNDSLKITNIQSLKNNVVVETYKDHRMAMAFAPLALKANFTINKADVVTKSYPDFWKDLASLGLSLKEK